MTETKKPAQSLAEIIHGDTQTIRRLLTPIARMVQSAQDPATPSAVDMLLEVQRQTLAAIEQLRIGQERILALLAQPNVEKAVREVMKG